MGRSRLTLKHIANDAPRKSTFRQRKDVLLNKMQELSNLCKGEACLIIYDTDGGDPQPVTWPAKLKTEHSLIRRYESEKNEEPPIMFGIQDYFNNKKEKVEADISKVRKEILKIKYPTSHPCFNNLGDEQIRNFIAVLDAKGRACGERMNMLRLQQQLKVNSALTSSDALNSSEVNFMQNNFQTHLIPTPLEPFDDSNHIASSPLKHNMDSQPQMLHFDPNPLHFDCATQVGSPNHVGVPPDLTIHSDPAIVSTNQLDEVDWDSLIDGLMDFGTLPHESVLYDDFLGYQNVQQQGAAFNTLTPLVDELQIPDYNNMVQADLFNHMNQDK
ncbi:PREDICTED: uncharacterized protein LOC109327505 [Lupinus angustifolius]|uniref:uncharacterized protein LOC109327505 n=1 Tax=Lupinus angustifolius TaxID=3871 RepID=UPI00092FCC49|nr:PREDICTED: uncharacterized protein LOC109327505 [Lupinus angustifolius]